MTTQSKIKAYCFYILGYAALFCMILFVPMMFVFGDYAGHMETRNAALSYGFAATIGAIVGATIGFVKTWKV